MSWFSRPFGKNAVTPDAPHALLADIEKQGRRGWRTRSLRRVPGVGASLGLCVEQWSLHVIARSAATKQSMGPRTELWIASLRSQ